MASIRCYKIEARGGVSQPPQTAPAQQPVQQPTPQSTYQQLPDFPPPVDANGNPKDDLTLQRMIFDLKNEYLDEIWKEV